MRANDPLSIRSLARAVETSLAPPEATVTERILEEATLRLVHTHLPTLCDAGLVQETDGSVELTPDPTLPYKEWLAMTAAVEFEAVESRDQWRERRGTADRHDEQLAYDEQANDFRSSLIGTTQ